MKKSLITTMVVAAGLSSGVALAASTTDSIGVVNYLQVFQQVPQGKATLDQMKAQLKPTIAQLKTQQAKLEQAAQTFNRNAPTLSASDRDAQAKQLQTQQQAFQQKVNALESGEMKKEQAAANAFNQALTSAINQVAQAQHLGLVLNSQAVPFYAPSYDVTTQVITLMEKQSNS